MNPANESVLLETRRQLFGRGARGLGVAALAALMNEATPRRLFAGSSGPATRPSIATGGLPSLPHFAPKAKRAIYLHMGGAPPQQDLFDYKPEMSKWFDKDLPESIRQGQRLTTVQVAASMRRRIEYLTALRQELRRSSW